MSLFGPNAWPQPLLGPDGAPHVVINGVEIEIEMESFDSSQVDEAGVYVESSTGQHVPHLLFDGPAAPLSVPMEYSFETKQRSDEIRRLVLLAPALAKGGVLSIWFDVPRLDVWEGNGTRTDFVLTHSTGYGSTGVTWAQRPSACWVGTTAQTMVTGAPSAGQCQLSQSADSTTITLGAAPAAGAIVQLLYAPLFTTCRVSVSESKDSFNSGGLSVDFVELVPERDYGS